MGGAFTDAELTVLRAQRLGRSATVGARGKPHVVPVGYRYDAEAAIDIWGLRLERSKKWGIWSRNGWALGSAGAGFASAPTG